MKFLWLLAALLVAPAAHAYTPDELRGDCQAAEEMYARQKSSDPFKSIRSARCIAYVAGFADSYAVSDYLAGKVGVKLNAFCLPNDPDLSMRLVRAVVIHVERVPPRTSVGPSTLVAGALQGARAGVPGDAGRHDRRTVMEIREGGLSDPQVIARGLRIDPGGVPGLRSPFVFSGATLALDRPAPRLGEHQQDFG